MNIRAFLSLLISVLILFSFFNCQKSDIKNTPPALKTKEQLDFILPGSTNGDITPQSIQKLVDALNDEILPAASGTDKDETIKISKYFESIKTKVPDHLLDEDSFIEMCEMLMRSFELLARIHPKNFDTNLSISINYGLLAVSIGGDSLSSKKQKRVSKEFKMRGVQAAKTLAEKFPKNPMSYGQLAHATLYSSGDEKEVVKLLNKCLEVDKKNQYCKDFLDTLSQK